MKGWQRAGLALLSAGMPLVLWLTLVAVGPALPQFGLVGALFELLVLPALLLVGFRMLAKAFPTRAFILGWIYFPLMFTALIYMGVMLAFRLHQDAF